MYEHTTGPGEKKINIEMHETLSLRTQNNTYRPVAGRSTRYTSGTVPAKLLKLIEVVGTVVPYSYYHDTAKQSFKAYEHEEPSNRPPVPLYY